jgi:serine/threonine-protein kinase SRPK3
MGELPRSVAFAGKYAHEFFNRKGELRNINKLRFWPLDAVLHDKYLFPRAEADAIASFLNPMLRLHPERRGKASDLVCHLWLEGVVVQGEVDVIRRAEIAERGVVLVVPEGVRLQGEGELEGRARTNGDDVDLDLGGVDGSGDTRPAGQDRKEKKRLSGLTLSEVDAMKPVGDFEVEEMVQEENEEEEFESQPPSHQPQPHPPRQSSPPTTNDASGKGKENAMHRGKKRT